MVHTLNIYDRTAVMAAAEDVRHWYKGGADQEYIRELFIRSFGHDFDLEITEENFTLMVAGKRVQMEY